MNRQAIAESAQQQLPVKYDPDALREYGEIHTSEEIIEGLLVLQQRRAEHLLHCYIDPATPPDERKQALYDYCVVSMAEDLLAPEKSVHNPLNFPRWLALAHARMAEFVMTDVDNRYMLTETMLFSGDENREYLHNFANSVSASIVPCDAHNDDRVFAVGVLTEQIRPWVLPKIRADELTLA